jgi:protein-tyrosine phosphatase
VACLGDSRAAKTQLSHIVRPDVIDLHCHILPGIDDGPNAMEDSLALARAAQACGTHVMVATPHVSWHYPNEAATVERLTDSLNERLRMERIAIEVRAGAEIAMTRIEEIEPHELARLRLGEGPWVLLEPPFTPIVTGLEGIVASLHGAGYRVVLAHPERCPAFHRDPAMVESLVRGGVLTSVTAGSLVGSFGGEVRRFSRRLFEQGLVHNVASDAHDATKRPPGIATELAQAGLEALADWLAREVPSAILSGGDIPPRPVLPAAPVSRLRRLRRRR